MKRVEVWWTDSAVPVSGGWTRLADYDHTPYVCQTRGYLVKETKTYIVVASSVAGDVLAGLVTIPKSAIRKRR